MNAAPKQRLVGRVAWVVGASSGIGEATALRMVHEGARVVVSARRADRLETVKARAGTPEHVAILPFDVLDFDAHAARVADAEAKFGPIDLVVHCAGVSQRALAEKTSLEVDRRIMDLNFFSVISLVKAQLPRMLGRHSGHLVIVSSVSGHVGSRGRTAYAASKHALHGFFDGLRAEVGDRGIDITMVCPGYVKTEISQSALTGDGRTFGAAAATADQNVQKGIDADRVAKAIVDGIVAKRHQVVIGGVEVAAIYLKRLAPGLLDRIVRRQKPALADE